MGFLRVIMKRMGFNKLWVDTVMKCVSTVSYSISVNGTKRDLF